MKLFIYRAVPCLVPRRLSSMCAQRKAGRRQRLRRPSVPFPWPLAVHHQSLPFRARLFHAKNEAPEEEAGAVPMYVKLNPCLARFQRLLSEK